MKVYIWGDSQESTDLNNAVTQVVDDLGLSDFINIESTHSNDLKEELGISKDSALIIEEESINFKDMIFEGMIPSPEEIQSMFLSIIGGGNTGGCAPGGCGSGCSC